MITIYLHKYADLDTFVSYVSNYPNQENTPPTYVMSVYPKFKATDITFDDIRAAFKLFSDDTWAVMTQAFTKCKNITIMNDDYNQTMSLVIRIPEGESAESYTKSCDDPEVDTIRRIALENILGILATVDDVMKAIKTDLHQSVDYPIECEITHNLSDAMASDCISYDSILSIFPNKELDSERIAELERMVDALSMSSISPKLAMMASASRVGFVTYIKVTNPSGNADEDPTEPEISGQPQIVKSVIDSVVAELTGSSENPQTNAFGLQ